MMTKDLNNLYTCFISFEKKFEVLNDESHSFIWAGLREYIFQQLLDHELQVGKAHDSFMPQTHRFIRQIIGMIILMQNSIRSQNNTRLYLKNNNDIEMMFWGHSRRKLENDGLYWDIYVDPITPALKNNNYIVIEDPYNFRHFRPSKTEPLFYADVIHVKSVIIASIIRFISFFCKKKHIYSNIQKAFDEEFKINLEIQKLMSCNAMMYKYKYNTYKKMIHIFSPKIIFLLVGYGREPLIRAAKDLHIPVVELQHGVLSKYHLGYDVSSGTKKDFADYFFSFGPAWGQMAHFPIPQKKIIPIGYQYLNTAVSKLKDVIKKDQVLFLSQGTIGDRLSNFAVNLLEHIPNHVKIVFKLHPGEYLRWMTEYKSLYDASEKGLLTVIAGDNPPLYELMAASKWQIGVNSTALFEGMAFKCKTYIVDLPGIEYVETLINKNEFILVQKPEQIDFTYDPESLKYRTEEYFSQDTETKFRAAIDFVMKDYYA